MLLGHLETERGVALQITQTFTDIPLMVGIKQLYIYHTVINIKRPLCATKLHSLNLLYAVYHGHHYLEELLSQRCTTHNAQCISTRTEQHSSLHGLQCIPVTVLSRVSPTRQLVHSTVQQRPLQAHKLEIPSQYLVYSTLKSSEFLRC